MRIETVREFSERLSMTQSELAKMLGRTQQAISAMQDTWHVVTEGGEIRFYPASSMSKIKLSDLHKILDGEKKV